jgi:uncharacterized membrane protein
MWIVWLVVAIAVVCLGWQIWRAFTKPESSDLRELQKSAEAAGKAEAKKIGSLMAKDIQGYKDKIREKL